ncbi:putative Xaa-Pro aminopeptidase [Peziza echinospora]|nr:putative Xaa-Pro aminopeptidase [Peziza echinospora]
MTSLTIPRLLPDPTVDPILAGKYPAKTHARNVAAQLRAQYPNLLGGLIYLKSAESCHYEDSDAEAAVRQRRGFFYLSGCHLLDSHLTYDLSTDVLTLYIPPISPEDVMWSGLPLSRNEALTQFDVDQVAYTNDTSILETFSLTASDTNPIFVIAGHLPKDIAHTARLDTTSLQATIGELRVVKDEYEIALIKHANAISTLAHHTVLRAAKTLPNERDAEALFNAVCTANGAPTQAYHGIFASGTSAATLHYVRNNADLPEDGNALLLVDAGAEYDCYASDITRTFPLNGEFTPEALAIYGIVLEMQKQCIAITTAGTPWEDVHTLAHRIAIAGLQGLGIFHPEYTVAEILEARTSCAFFPHGLGHWLGMDTHDTGGNANYKDPDPMFKYLRVRRKLVEGAVVTVEPGIYFCEFIINDYLKEEKHAKYVDQKVLERYWAVGGVRIEDNILVGAGGNTNLTTTAKEVKDMLALINGEPPAE